jgi:hypothetical protein
MNKTIETNKITIPKSPKPTETEIAELQRKLANEALKAIDAKKYPLPYQAKAKQIIKIGLGIYGRGHSLAIIKY